MAFSLARSMSSRNLDPPWEASSFSSSWAALALATKSFDNGASLLISSSDGSCGASASSEDSVITPEGDGGASTSLL